MNLAGSIAKLQKIGIEFYLELAKSFNSNELIHSTWLALAQDLEQQSASLKELPRSVWNGLKMPEDVLSHAGPCCPGLRESGGQEGKSLANCFARILDYEEPLILKIYVPIIRSLRTAWIYQALDFYIIVKAHVARLARLVEPFSIDPTVVHRSVVLLEHFEKEVQSPPPPARIVAAHARNEARVSGKAKRAAGKASRTAKAKRQARKNQNPVRRKKSASSRAKPILSKISVGRRRARR